MAELLIQKGAYVNAVGQGGYTALIFAADAGKIYLGMIQITHSAITFQEIPE